MGNVVNILLVIDAIIMIVFVLLQSGKSEGLSGAISGGAEQLFGKQKARGLDLVLHRGTVITGTLFFVLAFMSAYFIYWKVGLIIIIVVGIFILQKKES